MKKIINYFILFFCGGDETLFGCMLRVSGNGTFVNRKKVKS